MIGRGELCERGSPGCGGGRDKLQMTRKEERWVLGTPLSVRSPKETEDWAARILEPRPGTTGVFADPSLIFGTEAEGA